MADTSNLSQFLTDVASAIKTKKGTTDKIPAANFDTEIASIETGIDTSDANATVNDITEGKTAYVNGEKITGTIPELTPHTGVLTAGMPARLASSRVIGIPSKSEDKQKMSALSI